MLTARGRPPRAKWEYIHVFLFQDFRWKGKTVFHLRSIGKAPWHERIYYEGTKFTNKRHLIHTFPLRQWMVRDV